MSNQLPPDGQSPPQHHPYAPPSYEQAHYPAPKHQPHEFDPNYRPPVVMWMMVYNTVLFLMYLAIIPLGFLFLSMPAEEFESSSDPILFGGLFIGMGFFFAFASGLVFILPRKKWVWIYHLVVICSGFTSACTMLPCIFLFIFYIKPETKAYFNAL